MAFAHSRGIIHRDLKPSNIMVGAFGEVLVMDWGLAKVSGSTLFNAANINPSDTKTRSLETAATEHGAVLGTPGFMAPEQNRGDISMIDQRTDVFGLGAIMNFMLGQKIGGSQSEIVPKRLLAIARKATATEMSARYSSVQEMADDLGRYLDDMPVKAYRENALERTARTLSRNRVAVVLILAYLLMRLLFILFSRH
ncbi:MAG TPA: hypothetical protein VFB79_02615 [Candidatus Angelobacter sp.]|nr:hypothetical protein [Candidatus Angelobacter sp.]